MKRTLYTLSIVAIVCGTIVWAAGEEKPKDFVFELGEFTISFDPNDPNDYTLAEKKLFYLTANPVPLDPNGVETMTFKQWLARNCIEAVEDDMAMWINRGEGQLLTRKAIKAKKVFKKRQ